jgi:hypothetical protein
MILHRYTYSNDDAVLFAGLSRGMIWIREENMASRAIAL